MLVQDIILDSSYDLEIINGDFVIAPSDPQHINLLFNSTVGSWKQYPLVGIGIKLFSASSGQADTLKRLIQVQLQTDGYKISRLVLQGNSVDTYEYSIAASRINNPI